MPAHGLPSPDVQPAKRQRLDSYEATSPRNERPSPRGQASDALSGSKAGQSSNFRNVSACNRCRQRKNRCDQKLPSCASCAKAGVACVGYDPITRKEIPRSYVFYLETRVEQLESLLHTHSVAVPPAEDLEVCSRPGMPPLAVSTTTDGILGNEPRDADGRRFAKPRNQAVDSLKSPKQGQSPAMLNIVSPSKPRSLASASGVSFARVVFAAVQYSVSDQNGSNNQAGARNLSGSGTSMRDSFFGLHTKPTIKPAPFPDKQVALRLVTLYFEHANPQIPILHRGEFMQLFDQAFATPAQSRGARELYMLNMVFAIGCGVIVGEPVKVEEANDSKMDLDRVKGQAQPEEYHASAIVHLESCLASSGGGLGVLQAVLLLANFALLRPVPPGLWYIIGVAVRLAVDLGLHNEDGGDIDATPEPPLQVDQKDGQRPREGSEQDRGRRVWIRDMRRRLWWCTYSFDRLVSTCVGRPFGISDQVITTELPSLLDDDYLSPASVPLPPQDETPSYKHVAHHYFRLRMLQSEIMQVLQHNQAQVARAGQNPLYPEMNIHWPSPFLANFDSFRSWRLDIDKRLFNWKTTAPTRQQTGVAFSTEFLELNYWQAIIMLYRQSLSVPAMFEGEYNTSNEVNSPKAFTAELREDEDKIYLKVAEAGQKILRIYRQLHLSGLVSYTYLSTHHLFMAGISYLYAIWHSPIVRRRLTMDEVDFTVLAAKSVFTDMIDKCPPAETCRDAFDRTARATIKMANSKGGFGASAYAGHQPRGDYTYWGSESPATAPSSRHRSQLSDHKPFGTYEHPLSDTLSSPTMSVTEGMTSKMSPSMPRKSTHESIDYPMSRFNGPSPAESQPIDPALVPTPSPLRRIDSQQSSGGGNAYLGQQVGLQGSMEYPDTQNMDFLQNLGASQNGEFGNVDQAPVDLGFGINWEGLPNEYGDGQQMNPFDTFFFGGQQGTGGNGGMGM